MKYLNSTWGKINLSTASGFSYMPMARTEMNTHLVLQGMVKSGEK